MYVLLPPSGQFRGQTPKGGWGPSNPELIDNPYGFAPFRKDTILLPFDRTAGQGLFLAAGIEINAFVAGADEEDQQAGYIAGVNKSDVETMAYEKGALAERGFNFEVNGMQIRAQRPLVISERGVAPTGATKAYPPWLDEYDQRLREAALSQVAVEYKHGKTKCTWILGNPSDWPTSGGATNTVVSNGANAATGIYLPLTTSDFVGAVDEPNKLKVTFKTGNYQTEISENADVPTTASVKVPLEVLLYGRIVSTPCENGVVCMPVGMDQRDVDAVLRAGLSQQELQVIADLRKGR